MNHSQNQWLDGQLPSSPTNCSSGSPTTSSMEHQSSQNSQNASSTDEQQKPKKLLGKKRSTTSKTTMAMGGGTTTKKQQQQLKAQHKAGLKFGGKKPHQVARRNERERKRVQQVNDGYELLAGTLGKWEALCGDKKLTKAETLKAAILYIQHLEDVLHQRPDSEPPMPTMPSAQQQQQQQMKREPTTATSANANFEWPRQCSSVGDAEMSGSFSGTNAIGLNPMELNGFFSEAVHQQQHQPQHFGSESPYFSASSSQSPPMAFHHQSQMHQSQMPTFGHNFMHPQNAFAPFEFI